MFGKQVDEILFVNGLMIVYFTDGNMMAIDFSKSTFKSPLDFMEWLDESGDEKIKSIAA